MTEPGQVRVFPSRQRVGWQAFGYLAGGAGFLGILLLRFLLLLRSAPRPGDDMVPGLIGGLSVIGIALIARGIFLLRSTVHVALDSVGVHCETYLGRQTILWTDIDRVERDNHSPMMGSKAYTVLRLVATTGKPLMTISETIADFEVLAAEVIARSTDAARHATYNSAQDEQRRVDRAARQIRWTAWGFGFFTLFMAAALGWGIHEELHLRRFATDADRVEATILRREMVRVTPHVEYTFEVQGQRYTRDATMWQGPEYDALEDKTTVPVEYLRSDPGWNRLVAGEDPGPQFGGKFLWVTGGGLVMFGALFVFTLLGFDFKTENGVSTLTRWGRPIKTWSRSLPEGPK